LFSSMAATDFLRKILLRFPAGKLRRATENNIFTLIRLTTYYLPNNQYFKEHQRFLPLNYDNVIPTT
ncbi:MAG TPA: hypothetical protein VJK72_01195, partial [Candidatus Nanoarchaeia archaeon]|nr:hypothetical protein [Candidatus Nanoarchaeia archaeon]